jgi:parallel beta-helix repeat protein
VYPTGVDDTANIQEAFDLVTANRAGKVKLVTGEYTVNEEIVVVNFDGSFVGAGQRKTVLKTTYREDWPHRDVEPFPVVASVFLFYQTDMAQRRVRICDMTVEVHATTYDYGGFFGLNVFDIYGNVDGEVTSDMTPLDSMLKRVTIIGDTAEAFPFTNVVNTFQVGGEPHLDGSDWSFEPITGTHFVVDCLFDTVGASIKYNSVNGEIYVSYNEIKDNLVGIWLFFCDTTDAPIRRIRNNEISGSNWLGMAVWGSNSFKIQYNSISDGDVGIDMFGSDGNRVKNNVLGGNNLDLSWDQAGDNVWKNNVYDTQSWP